jgi:hypothetical protein
MADCDTPPATKCLNTPPATNIKCIFFTLFVLTIYFLPKNKWILLLLLYLPYGILAHYDWIYQCDGGGSFKPTYLRMFYEFWKPYCSKQRIGYRNWCPKQSNHVFWVDIVMLILFLIFFVKYFLPWDY